VRWTTRLRQRQIAAAPLLQLLSPEMRDVLDRIGPALEE